MAGVNLSLLSACERSFGGVKESGYGREGAGYREVFGGQVDTY